MLFEPLELMRWVACLWLILPCSMLVLLLIRCKQFGVSPIKLDHMDSLSLQLLSLNYLLVFFLFSNTCRCLLLNNTYMVEFLSTFGLKQVEEYSLRTHLMQMEQDLENGKQPILSIKTLPWPWPAAKLTTYCFVTSADVNYLFIFLFLFFFKVFFMIINHVLSHFLPFPRHELLAPSSTCNFCIMHMKRKCKGSKKMKFTEISRPCKL